MASRAISSNPVPHRPGVARPHTGPRLAFSNPEPLEPATPISTGRHRLVNIRQRALIVAKWRALWVLVGFALLAICALVRLSYLGVTGGTAQRARGTGARGRTHPLRDG